jgi:DNA polymerase II small subunit
VDGIGIYPGQEHHLTIGDIYDQYAYFAKLLENVPEHIRIIVQPGNHDAARPIEPQPAMDREVTERFDGLNATFVGNPSLFTLHDVRVLSYHGCSLMDFATSVQGLEHHDPLPIMEEILKCRHLAPIYGQSTPLAPEHKDYMVIDTIPELFVTGHVHTFETKTYRGVNMMNCSTWQGQTDYQKMLNFKPNPAMLPIFDLQHLKMTAVDFSLGMDFSYGNRVT